MKTIPHRATAVAAEIATATLLVFLACAGAKSAEVHASSRFHQGPASSADFTVMGSNGYQLAFNSERGKVTILVARGPLARHNFSISLSRHNFSISLYAAQGSDSPHAINAEFGSLGEVSVRFKPSGKVKVKNLPKPGKGCMGPRRIVRKLGTFVGTVRFIGEGGYTSVDVEHARGSVGTIDERSCAFTVPVNDGGHREHRPLKSTYLGATTADNHLGFAASSDGARPRVGFSAQSIEQSGAVSIMRFVSARGQKSSFAFDNALGSATVAPPPPFAGTAAFQRNSKSPPSWTGTLSVSFVGATDVPLAGPAFRAFLRPLPALYP